MSILLSIEEATDRSLVGGKALALGLLRSKGFRVPPALCVTTLAYRRFVDASGLPASIARELGRKRFEDMRWEEIWDASLRIRGLFDRAGWPADLESDLREGLERAFGERPVAVRSSAPGEDGGKASFAGLHESFLNVRGPSAVLGRVRQVFASLWSDRALLYRKELGLDPEGSEMAVLVQEMVSAQRSGVVFGVSPSDPDRAVVEAVWGLNEGLVDGTVEPDRWILRRDTGDVLSFRASAREKWVVPGPLGTEVADLPADRAGSPPISREEIPQVYRAAMEAEALFGSPQDVEWSFGDGGLSVLQSRPITARRGAGGDERAWYLTLRRSHANLKVLKDRVERELLPEMAREADAFASIGLSRLSDDGLEEEIRRRGESVRKWEEIYRGEFIPLAHGVRLFGEFYNDHLAPGDPFEFVRLLPGTGMLSVERNSGFGRLAERLRTESSLAEAVRREGKGDADFERRLERLLESYGDVFASSGRDAGRRGVLNLLLEMALAPAGPPTADSRGAGALRNAFLSRFEGENRKFAEELLDLARDSYRLRDDDNIYLGRLQSAHALALEERAARSAGRREGKPGISGGAASVEALNEPGGEDPATPPPLLETPGFVQRDRQLVGQPAGPGYARGVARVARKREDLFLFRSGEILVCDAVDPNMTFVVPLAGGIVERRGGMLIHGAIIAREYGIPCVTGIPDAVHRIRTGDLLSVDGFLGIVTREKA